MDTATYEEKFHHAVELIKNLPKSGNYQPSNDLKLKFYSYFKQATEGPCSSPKPAFWDVVNRAKWEAWSRLGQMTKQEAMELYVDEFVQILMGAPFDEKAKDYVHLMGPFFHLAPSEFKEEYEHAWKLNGTLPNSSGAMLLESEDVRKSIKGKKPNKDKIRDFSNESSEDSHHMNGGVNMNGTADSDSEEFSDTFDQCNGGESESENLAIPAKSHEDDTVLSDSTYSSTVYSTKDAHITQARGGGDHRLVTSDGNSPLPSGSGNRGNRVHRRGRGGDFPSHHRPSNHSADGGSGGRRGDDNRSMDVSSDVNEQLALAVIRLQHTMEQVVMRLDSLEALLQESKANSCLKVSTMKNSVSSIFGIPLRAVILIIAWPFLARWLIYVIQKRRRRI